MRFCKYPALISLFLILISLNFITYSTYAATFNIVNNCPYTVWAAAKPGGGRRLDQGQNWTMSQPLDTVGRIWARPGCRFDGSGQGKCQTGDCGGALQCEAYGQSPNTLARYTLAKYWPEDLLPFGDMDFFDISLVDGFNVPMEFSSTSRNKCIAGISCNTDINGQCPNELRALGGCKDPCTVFKTDEYCCESGDNCGPTNYSRFFKDRCPNTYSYPKDDQSSRFVCP